MVSSKTKTKTTLLRRRRKTIKKKGGYNYNPFLSTPKVVSPIYAQPEKRKRSSTIYENEWDTLREAANIKLTPSPRTQITPLDKLFAFKEQLDAILKKMNERRNRPNYRKGEYNPPKSEDLIEHLKKIETIQTKLNHSIQYNESITDKNLDLFLQDSLKELAIPLADIVIILLSQQEFYDRTKYCKNQYPSGCNPPYCQPKRGLFTKTSCVPAQ